MELSHPVIMQLLKNDGPVLIKECLQMCNGGVGFLNRSLGGFRSRPLLSHPCPRKPLRLRGVSASNLTASAYGTDDCDLLSGIAHHVGALLSHANLSEERQASAELEALHRFSVFCLHDLKNLAARLSLIAQNVENHGRDPAFQESAMRTVADTAKKITALVSKLSLKSVKPTVADRRNWWKFHALVEESRGSYERRWDGPIPCDRRAGSADLGDARSNSPSSSQCGTQCQASHRPEWLHLNHD